MGVRIAQTVKNMENRLDFCFETKYEANTFL